MKYIKIQNSPKCFYTTTCLEFHICFKENIYFKLFIASLASQIIYTHNIFSVFELF